MKVSNTLAALCALGIVCVTTLVALGKPTDAVAGITLLIVGAAVGQRIPNDR